MLRLVRISVTSAVFVAAISLNVGPTSAADGRNGALLGGLAAGVVGGVLLDQALQPRQLQYVEPAPPPPVYVQPAPVYDPPPPPDPYFTRLRGLHRQCDDGSRHACIEFGIIIGEHKERVAEWRRDDPDMFSWDTY